MPQFNDSRLLVGSATADDAGVFQLDDDRALVQTLDFFTPIADDPYLFGQIAAANSLSDVYAMGARPITAMAIAGMPDDKITNDQIAQIFRGGADMVKQAKCSLVGGHTIKNPEPIYGLSVTGLVHPKKFLANGHSQIGDTLILSKPLGTGIIATAVKRGLCPPELEQLSIKAMTTLNTVGADLGELNLVNGCTDITGFGLLGHLREMMEGSNTTAEIDSSKIPAISKEVLEFIEKEYVPGGTRKNLLNVAPSVSFGPDVSGAMKLLLSDAQTSGGLLISVPQDNKNQVLDLLGKSNSLCAAEIGTVTEKASHPIMVS